MSYICEPIYRPDPGHEDKNAHGGPFYAIFCKEWRGCVTSKCVLYFFFLFQFVC